MRGEGLWSAAEVANALRIPTQVLWWAESVAIDSRTLKPGAIYVALKGERVDGHDFVKDALQKGAAAAIVDHVIEGIAPERLLVVKDTAVALRLLGKAARERTKAKVIGITGSIGKTTTKEMHALMLKDFGRTYATTGNLNNHYGVPLTLANMPRETDYAVIEMGMNHQGEIAELTSQVMPDIALITTVEAVHLEHFESVHQIALAKSEIFMGLKHGGIAVLNRDNVHFNTLEKEARIFHASQIISFGQNEAATICLKNISENDDGTRLEVGIAGNSLTYTMQASGDGAVYASLAALSTARALGLNTLRASQAIQEFKEVEGRGRMLPVIFDRKSMWWMDDSYNAGPASMKAAFKKLAGFAKRNPQVKRTAAILGDMLELGPQSAMFHQELANQLVEQNIDIVYAAGPMMKQMMLQLPEKMQGGHANLASDLVDIVKNALRTGDAVVFKGSHGSKIYTVVEALKQYT